MTHFFSKAFLIPALCCTCVFAFAGEQDTSAAKRGGRLPVISFSQGLMYFLGDVGYSHLNEPVTSKSGMQFELQKHTNTRLSISLFILGGKVAGQEKSAQRQLNFESGIVAEGLQLRYDFYSRRKNTQFLIPYVSAGIEYMVFHARGDLKDGDGNTYHYWDDGTIRSMDQHDTMASQAHIVYRDYKYETDLRDENIDGFGKYRQSTIGFPVGAGARFRISNRVALHFGAVVHLTKTDLIDNVNNKSTSERVGNGMKDKIIFAHVAFRYDLSGKREAPRKDKLQVQVDKEEVRKVNLDSLAGQDADHDGIDDMNDDVLDSATNSKVDHDGVPVDSDGDGIPDYRDKEVHSSKDALVDLEGVTITEEMIEAKWRSDSLAALPAIVEYLHHTDKFGKDSPADAKREQFINVLNGDQSKTTKEIPAHFRSLDTDGNNQISPAEIGTAIDSYLDGKSNYSVQEFYELIDFFFSQN